MPLLQTENNKIVSEINSKYKQDMSEEHIKEIRAQYLNTIYSYINQDKDNIDYSKDLIFIIHGSGKCFYDDSFYINSKKIKELLDDKHKALKNIENKRGIKIYNSNKLSSTTKALNILYTDRSSIISYIKKYK